MKNTIPAFAFSLILFFGTGSIFPNLYAQGDTLPRIVAGKVDWEKVKQKTNAPRFNQKDVVMYLVRQQGLAEMFGSEQDDHWVQDFHFTYLNDDPHLDAIYDGETMYQLGSYVILMVGDTVLSYPKAYESRGHMASFEVQEKGIAYLVRKEAYGADYALTVGSYWYDFEKQSNTLLWEVIAVQGEEVPVGSVREEFTVNKAVRMRMDPVWLEEGTVDLDLDGEADLNGNVTATFGPGSRFVRTHRMEEEDGEAWSFVIALTKPVADFAYGTQREGMSSRFVAGWIRDAELK